MSSSTKLEDVPELMQHIQLLLPVKEAARTSVLSKSWLHAWSTIPNLKFHFRLGRKGMKLVDMDRILTRYLRDNVPIDKFDLDIDIQNKQSDSLAEKCIGNMARKNTSSLKELSLSFHLYGTPLSYLPHEILTCENLTKMRVLSDSRLYSSLRMTSHHSVITKCVSLRELYLNRVNICQELLNGILSSCRLLVKIVLIHSTQGLNIIKVTNLPCLNQLRIVTEDRGSTALELNHVPNLCVFTWGGNPKVLFKAHPISLGSSLKELSLSNVVKDIASLDMIKAGAPFLETLTIDTENRELESFHFTCASIKKLFLLSCPPSLIDVKVYAPNLLFFRLDGDTMPRLLFPISTLIKQTMFRLDVKVPIDASFFLKMREALALSSNCDIYINTNWNRGLHIDVDVLRARVPFPRAMNVQHLSFETSCDKCMWKHSPFFDAFFEICHPSHVTAMQDRKLAPNNHFCKVLLSDVLEKKKNTSATWPWYLKHVEISRHAKWETLSDSHKIYLKGPNPSFVDFKLERC